MANGRLDLAQDEACDCGMLERAASSEAALAGTVDGMLDMLQFHVADHGQVGQALLDRPPAGSRTPVEFLLGQARCEGSGVFDNMFKLFTIGYELGMHHRPL